MGNNATVPQKLPLLNAKQTEWCIAHNIQLDYSDQTEIRYIKYRLPEGWTVWNASYSKSYPVYYICDKQNTQMARIDGEVSYFKKKFTFNIL